MTGMVPDIPSQTQTGLPDGGSQSEMPLTGSLKAQLALKEVPEADVPVALPLALPLPDSPERVPPPYGINDVERYAPEPPKRLGRTAFERDRARLVHSANMRRLGAKTQVLAPGSVDDFSRTRLTHSLEVAQIGREMGRALGADPDLVDTACLAHDIGHPPFGHNGELALAKVAENIGGFEGNAQTFRVLTRLEPKITKPDGTSAGLNLTRASLDACIKYPWGYADRPTLPNGKLSPKFGVYADDRPVFDWVRANSISGADGKPRKSFEAQIMDLADDIAYSVHDVEDAIVGGRVDFRFLDDDDLVWQVIMSIQDWYGDWYSTDELAQAIERLRETGYLRPNFDGTRGALAALKDATSSLIGRFSGAAQIATKGQYGAEPLTRYQAELVVPVDTKMEIMALKGIAVHFVMYPRQATPFAVRQREVVAELFQMLAAQAPTGLEPEFAADWANAPDDTAKLRVVVDQVASLSDAAALHWHGMLTGTGAPTALA